MPKIPKVLGDLMETTFSGRFPKVTVTATEYLGPMLKRIQFSGDFHDVNFKAGQAIIIRVDATNYRNYTPSSWNSAAGNFEVIFHLHGNGPGSAFIEQLQPKDQLTIALPRGFNIYKKEEKHHFFFGDETGIGLFKSLKDKIDRDGTAYHGIFELDSAAITVPKQLGLNVDVVPKSINRAEFAVNWFNQSGHTSEELLLGGAFYLVGNAKSIQRFRTALKNKGVQNRQIVTQPYWADGKVGL